MAKLWQFPSAMGAIAKMSEHWEHSFGSLKIPKELITRTHHQRSSAIFRARGFRHRKAVGLWIDLAIAKGCPSRQRTANLSL